MRTAAHIHATETTASPTVRMLRDKHFGEAVSVTIPADRINFEQTEDNGGSIVRIGRDGSGHLYLTIEQAVRMATDILATTMGVRDEPRGAA